MNYALYTRCSTEDQKKGFSHEYQLNGLKSHQRLVGGHCVGTYQDTISGRTFTRKKLDELINYCQKHRGAIDYIFVYKWDRFGRDTGLAFECIKTFRTLGVEINCPDQWIDFKDSNWPLLQALNFGIAQAESLKISERTRDANHTASCGGYYIGKSPFGYSRKEKEGNSRRIMQPNKDAEIVKIFFEAAANGVEISELYKRLKPQISITRKGMYDVLHKKIYAGYYTVVAHKNNPSKEVKGLHKPIISLELYESAQARLSSKKIHAPHPTFEFWAKESIIGKKNITTYLSTGKNKRNKYPYYDGGLGNIRNANKVHDSILATLKTLTGDNIPESYIQDAKNIFAARYEAEKENLTTLKIKITNETKKLKKLESDYLENNILPSVFTNMHNDLSFQIELLNQDFEYLEKKYNQNLNKVTGFIEHLINIGKLFVNADGIRKAKLLQAIFPAGITIDEKYTLRTPEINEIVELFYCKSAICEIKNPTLYVKDWVSSPCVTNNELIFAHHLDLLLRCFAA